MKFEEEQFVRTGEAASILGVSNATVYRMIKNNLLNPIKTPGGQRRFSLSELESYKSTSNLIEAPQNPSKKRLNLKVKELNDKSNPGEEKEQDAEEKGVVDPRNKLNNLTGKEWLPETKSFLYQKGLGAKHAHAKIERMHPAPFSFQDVSRLIGFFTKEGESVLDPFSGVGSTAKASALLNRICTGIELSEHWNSLGKERLETEVSEGESLKHNFINGDCRVELKKLDDDSFDFMVTSPPYWTILNKKADHKVKEERLKDNLATNYSDSEKDLGNIEDYDEFLDILVNDIFIECGRVLKPRKYMCIIVSDFRNKSDFISFHSDLIQRLNKRQVNDSHRLNIQGVKVLIQNHKSLLPYGYPFAYVENIHHQYILIFRKS